MAGGIFRFLGLIHRHRGAVEYDFRARFGVGLRAVDGVTLTISEAARLATLLLGDSSSMTGAAASGWSRPATSEALALADVFDLLARANSKSKPRPYPRPWDQSPTRMGRVTRPQREIREALAARGHN